MIIDALEEGIGLEAAGDRTDPGSIEIRANWMVGSSITNRTNRKQSAWKNAEHIVLTDPMEKGFIDNVWKLVVAKDKAKPCIQKVYVNDGDPSEYTMYDAVGKVDSGPLSMLLVQGLKGEKVKVATFARVGFDLISEKGLWTLDDLSYLVQKQSGTDFRTHAIPVLKEKHGNADETKVDGHVRYYSSVVYSIFGVDYYLTKEWFENAYDVLAEFFIAHELTIKEIVQRIVRQEGGAMYTGKLGQIQKIVYGAPGTGKSFGTDGELTDTSGAEKAVRYRTTFHPDSDYSTFVGAYKPTMNGNAIEYAFRPQAFMDAYVKAWRELVGLEDNPKKPVVLVIEEINRGNCAQIFGDLFQLLDRDDATGYSTYPITTDKDLATWLKGTDQFGVSGLSGIEKPKCIKQSDWDDILKGDKLALPPTLYIWATMNTSDQSLFPIDSAFKRRWDWKYVPIAKPDTTGKADWKDRKIVANNNIYDWWEFISIINAKIADLTKSEDKQLGYFFVKAPDATGHITAERFANKVLYYLFYDVFKDWDLPPAIFGKGTEKDKYAFKDFFYAEKTTAGRKVFKPGDVKEEVVAEFIEKQQDKSGKKVTKTALNPPDPVTPASAPAPAPEV